MKKTKLYLSLATTSILVGGITTLALASCSCGPKYEYGITIDENKKQQYVDMFNDFTTKEKTVIFTGFSAQKMTTETIDKLTVEIINKQEFLGSISAKVINVLDSTFDLAITFRANVYITTSAPTFDIKFNLKDTSWSQTITGFGAIFAYSNVTIVQEDETRTSQTIYAPTGTTSCTCLIKTGYKVYHNGNIASDDFINGLTIFHGPMNEMTSTIEPEVVTSLGGVIYVKLNITNLVEEVNNFKFKFRNTSCNWESDIFSYEFTITHDTAQKFTITESDTIKIDECNSTEENIEIPDTINGKDVTKFKMSAFNYCASMKSFKLNTKIIANDAQTITPTTGWFKGCYNLETITVPDGNENYTSKNSAGTEQNCVMTRESKGSSTPKYLIAGCKTTVFSSAITDIYPYAFAECFGLTNVELPEATTIVHDHAFDNCVELKTFKGKSIEYLYPGSFANCKQLTSIECGNKFTQIYDCVFENCTSLKQIYIPAKITSISPKAFNGCVNLESITVDPENTKYTSSLQGTERNGLFEIGTDITLLRGCKRTGLTNEVKVIGENAFNGCEGLTNINIPTSVTTIGKQAFYGCVDLETIDIPNSVTKLGESCFAECYKLYKAVINASCEELPENMFSNCYILEDVQLKGTIKSLGKKAFENNYCLWNITFPANIKKINYNTFSGCYFLSEAHFAVTSGWIQKKASSEEPIMQETLADPTNAAYYILQDLYDARNEMYHE